MKKKGLAIITGASQGIGSAVAIGLAKDGYRVVCMARNKKNLEKIYSTISKIEDVQQEPLIIPIDITNYHRVEKEIKNINRKYGDIDILVNSAGIFIDGSLNASILDYKKIVELNLTAQYYIMQKVVEIMKNQKNGYIFNLASRAGKYGFPGGGIYGSTKFALIGLTESLYRELAPLGIRVTSLCPGWVNTKMAYEAGATLSENEMIQPEDVLDTIRYLLKLSKNVCVKEIVLEMNKSII